MAYEAIPRFGQPRTDVERAARHFGISEGEVTETHLSMLPARGYGLGAETTTGKGGPEVILVAMGGGLGAPATRSLE